MHRRDLFWTIPAAAVRSSAANSAVTIGLIGAGNRGPYVAQSAVKAGARVIAISDLYEDKIAAARKSTGSPDAVGYTDYTKLLESKVDAVIIATPVFLHAKHFEDAIRSGKHIYIEKPAAASVADVKRIMSAADAADRKVNISFGFQRRYGSLYQKAKAIQDADGIGKVRWARVEFLKSESIARRRNDPPPRTEAERIKNWGSWRETSGDLIVENNIHVIDVMNWFVGARPVSAVGSGGRNIPGYGDMRDHGTVVYQYPGNVQGTMMGMTVAPSRFRSVTEQFHGDRGVLETSENFVRHTVEGVEKVFERSPRNPSLDSLEAFVRRVAEGKPENTGVRGCESTLTAILGRMAMDAGRVVTWDEMMRSA